MTWLELSVDVDPEAVESISELLAREGYNGGVVVDQPIIPGADGPEYSFDASKPVTLRTYIPVDERVEAVRARVEHALWHFGQIRPVGPLRVRSLEEEDWANAWKQHYTVHHIGERTVIVPSWLEYEAQPGDIVLRLDPGMAFGTGLHPTTQLCLAFIEHYVKSGASVLDLGCGSGILAVAAARLGATVLALDTDPIAVEATRENVTRNDVAGRVTVAEGSLGAGATMGHWLSWDTETRRQGDKETDTSPFPPVPLSSLLGVDLIVANIIARVLAALAQDMADALKPGGTLIASGIIADREQEVVDAFAAARLAPRERRQEGDWVALVYQKQAD
jgi:ribosomal protein L11 methyltransferase